MTDVDSRPVVRSTRLPAGFRLLIGLAISLLLWGAFILTVVRILD